MNIAVCVKQVPAADEAPSLDPSSHRLRRDGKPVLDEADTYGVELALTLADLAVVGDAPDIVGRPVDTLDARR